jgi:ABC-type phosphate/phosphonate transport system substrate-binding protein
VWRGLPDLLKADCQEAAMMRRKTLVPALALLVAGLALMPAGAPAQDNGSANTVKIGMAGSLFRDVPEVMVKALTPPFQSLMHEQTGMRGEIVVAGEALDMGRCLNDKELQLGVFQGFEFAWAQQKYPDLRPLVIAVTRHRTLYAYLIVRNDNSAAGLADLKGKTISLPRRTREHCLLFLERACKEMGAESKDLFTIVNHSNVEDALDDVVRDKVQAVVVDGVSLEAYEQLKSGCYARLKVLKKSEPFPPSVVAYRQGTLNDATLARFRTGMINANQTPRGRELMALWKLTAFERVPADYAEALAAVLKAYPAPDESAERGKAKH